MARATFSNRIAWAIWIFMGIWMLFLCLMTYVLLRDGPPQGYSAATVWSVVFAFWLFGSGASVWAAGIRTVHVEVTDSGALLVTWRSPVGAERRRIEAADVPVAEVVHGTDSDGDPYFTSRVTLPDGATIDLAEGRDEAAVAAATARSTPCGPAPRPPSESPRMNLPSPTSPHVATILLLLASNVFMTFASVRLLRDFRGPVMAWR